MLDGVIDRRRCPTFSTVHCEAARLRRLAGELHCCRAPKRVSCQLCSARAIWDAGGEVIAHFQPQFSACEFGPLPASVPDLPQGHADPDHGH